MANVNEIKKYLNDTLGVQVQPTFWENTKALPFLLRDRYEFYTAYLLKAKCLFMVGKDREEPTPAVIKKHGIIAKEKWDGNVVYVPQVMSTFNRGRLIDQKVPFIVPGKQLYLPDLGLDLREHVEKIRLRTKAKTVSPATQVVILDALLHEPKEPRNANQLAGQFGYAAMTITRAMNELEDFGLGTVRIVGRERRLVFDLPGKQLWEKAKPHLQNPVFKTVYVQNIKPIKEVVRAGMSALADYTNIVEPENKTLAISRRGFRTLNKNHELVMLPIPDKGTVNLEIWRYGPERLARQGVVDRFSLFLSLKEDNDERVEMAKKKMMEKVSW